MRGNLAGYRLKTWMAIVLVFSLLVSGCGSTVSPVKTNPGLATPNSVQNNPDPKTIRIYASLPLSGISKNQGQSLVNAMQLALGDASNGTNLVAGFKLDFVPLDNTSAATGRYSIEQEASNAKKAAADPDTMLYLGPINTETAQVAIPILNAAGVAMLSPGTTYPGLTKVVAGITKADEPAKYYPNGQRNYFRLLPTDELQGRADASFTEAKLQSRTVYVVDDGTDYGVGLAKAYEQASNTYNLKLLGRNSLANTAEDYASVTLKIKEANPQVIFYSGNSTYAARLLTGVRAAGVNAYFLGGGGIQDSNFLQEAGAAGEGVYSSISGTDSSGLSPKGEAFLKAYRARYGDTLQSITIYGYDAMSAAIEAIKLAGQKDRAIILKTVASLKNFTGASGNWSFDQNGDTNLTVFCFYLNKNQKWLFDSIADTTNNSRRPSTLVAVTGTPSTVGVASITLPVTSPAVSPNPVAATTIAGSPIPAGQRVDAASQLPPPFQLYRLAGLPLVVYIPPSLNATSVTNTNQPTQVLVALHGMFENGGNFGASLLAFAQEHKLVLIAPTFNYNVNYKMPEVVSNEDLELTAQLGQAIGQLSQVTHLNFKDRLLLFGFSRGAQLAHHYALLYPAQTLGVAVLSSGAYTLPLTKLNNQILLFPYGISNLSDYSRHSFDQINFVQVAFDVQVGALDSDPSQVSRAWDSYIGTDRVTRGRNFYRALNQEGIKAQFNIIPNTRHEVNPAQVEIARRFLQPFVGK